MREIGGPVFVTRYNLYTAAADHRQPAAGHQLRRGHRTPSTSWPRETLPLSMKTEWTELMFMQIRAGNTAMYVFALAVVCVFLALAALYESWSLPLAVILVVPLCLLCSVAGRAVHEHVDVNIFVQIGLVVLVGPGVQERDPDRRVRQARCTQEGQPRLEATREASRLRLRPILMTSFAFILGVVPLVRRHGAGAEMRRSLGTAVFSGMLGVTLFGIFLTPVFFYVIQGLGETRLFAAAPTRWVGSLARWAALLGLAVGFLLARLGVVPLPWAPWSAAARASWPRWLILGVRRRSAAADAGRSATDRPARTSGGPTP